MTEAFDVVDPASDILSDVELLCTLARSVVIIVYDSALS